MSRARRNADLDRRLDEDAAWAARRCADTDPEVFFLKGHQREALRVCAPCPARDLCLEAALVAEEGDARRWGVFGGLPPDDRARRASRVPNAHSRRVAS